MEQVTDTQETTETTGSQTFVLEDGSLADGWMEAVAEDSRDSNILGKYKTLPDLAKGLVNAQRMVGKDKVAIPGPNSTDDEIEAF